MLRPSRQISSEIVVYIAHVAVCWKPFADEIWRDGLNMTRFSCLDYFILSGTLFEESIMDASVQHDVGNLSDHDPIFFLHLMINMMLLACSDHVFTPWLSWAKAGTGELGNFASILSRTLQAYQPPDDALLCTDRCCKDSNHHDEIAHYAEAITRARVSAADIFYSLHQGTSFYAWSCTGLERTWWAVSSEIIIMA